MIIRIAAVFLIFLSIISILGIISDEQRLKRLNSESLQVSKRQDDSIRFGVGLNGRIGLYQHSGLGIGIDHHGVNIGIGF